MNPRRLVATIAAMAAAVVMAAAADFDYGASLDSSTTYGDRPTTGADDWEQRLRAAVWFAADFGPRLTLEGQVSYLYTLDRPYLFDLDLLSLTGTHPLGASMVLSWQAGRFGFADPTGLILSHTADGFSAALGSPVLGLTVRAAYTGLLLKPEANLSMSAADAADKDDDDVYFAPRRLFGSVEFALPEVLARQTPVIFALAQFDLREDQDARLHSQYWGLRVSGPVADGFYWDGAVVVESGRDETVEENLLGLLATGGLRYYRPDLLYSRLELRGTYGSGPDSTWDGFLPISKPTLALAWTAPLADLILLEASYSLKPFAAERSLALANLQVFLKGLAAITAVDREYLGSVIEGGVNARPTSDFGCALKSSAWIPPEGDIEWALRFEASMAF